MGMPSLISLAPSASRVLAMALVTKWMPRCPVMGSTTWMRQLVWTGEGKSRRSGPRRSGPK